MENRVTQRYSLNATVTRIRTPDSGDRSPCGSSRNRSASRLWLKPLMRPGRKFGRKRGMLTPRHSHNFNDRELISSMRGDPDSGPAGICGEGLLVPRASVFV
jgi:hypothetical protein